MATNYNPKIVKDGLTTYYDFANSKCYSGTGTNIYDMSKAQQNAVIINGALYSSDNNGIINFDGINDYVGTSTSTTSRLYSAWTLNGVYGYPTQKSIEVWFKTSDSAGLIVSRPWNGAGRYNYRLAPNFFDIVVGGSGGPNTSDQSKTINFTNKADGNWHQCVFFMDKTNHGVSFDGNATFIQQTHDFTSGSGAYGGYSNYGDGNLPTCIMTLYPYGGSWGGATSYSVSGSVSIFRQYNRVLTQDEIKQNFEATRGRFGI